MYAYVVIKTYIFDRAGNENLLRIGEDWQFDIVAEGFIVTPSTVPQLQVRACFINSFSIVLQQRPVLANRLIVCFCRMFF
jgi:hypothetical protein